MFRIAVCGLALSLSLLVPSSTWAAEARTLAMPDLLQMGGTRFNGGVGDLLLRNDKVEAVVHAVGATPDFNISFSGEVLPSSGVLVDVGNRGQRNDQMNEIHHILNLSASSFVLYMGDPVLVNGGSTASITVRGIGLLNGKPSTLTAVTTYSVTDGNSWIDITTSVQNTGNVPVTLFSVADADVMVGKSRLPFQPFPDRGPKSPPLDLGNTFPSIGRWSFLAVPGNNGPADGPTNNDLSPVGEVSYVFVPESLEKPLMGVASNVVAISGNVFDVQAQSSDNPPQLAPGASLTHVRKLVVAPKNSVEAGLSVALPLLFKPLFGGLDARATFTGRVVDTKGNPVAGAHLVFDNTAPGSPADLSPLATVVDDDDDGTPEAVLLATAGKPLPMTHEVTGADGRFTVRLQALRDPASAPSIYSARIQAENRDTKEIGPMTVSLATISGGPQDLGDIPLSGTGTLRYRVSRVSQDGTREDSPVKLTIYGIDGTDNPDFGRQYLSLRNFIFSKRNGDGLTPVTSGNSSQLGETFSGTRSFNVILDHTGHGEVELAPGRYRIYASRGIEYSIDVRDVTVTDGDVSLVRLDLRHVVTAPGYVSVDGHIHSTKSYDASAPMTDRVVAYLAAGVDVMVGTDHNFTTDYRPIIARLGVRKEITAIVGEELSGALPVPKSAATGNVNAFPQAIGHWGAWPLSVIPGARRNGAPSNEFLNPGTAIDRLRGVDSLPLLGATPDTATLAQWLAAIQAGQPGTPGASLPPDREVVVFNHPRSGKAGTVVIGLLNSLANPSGDPMTGGYNPTLPITASPNDLMTLPSLYNKTTVGPDGTDTTGLSFDAMEILNGTSLSQYLQVRQDWFSLLDQGISPAGMANSDSHRPVLENSGYGRTYIASKTQSPEEVDENELVRSLRARRAFGTTGPILRFDIVSDADGDRKKDDHFFDGMGKTVVATHPTVTLKIRVEAAPWIPVEEVRIFRNGQLILTKPIASHRILGGPVLRFEGRIDLTGIDADSYFMVEAGVRIDPTTGNPLSPQLLTVVQSVEPTVVPLAFSNPIFVDRDGNGYTPPGLP
ncbi:MAG TPA: hypothetical protein VGS07_30410 [Thermoanaerobaculia bacterium]|jgi:hypothetical protein|nr:hypothetical protein [Thermoanaerobaculia bacterium]